jgi:hypothetical protein
VQSGCTLRRGVREEEFRDNEENGRYKDHGGYVEAVAKEAQARAAPAPTAGQRATHVEAADVSDVLR